MSVSVELFPVLLQEISGKSPRRLPNKIVIELILVIILPGVSSSWSMPLYFLLNHQWVWALGGISVKGRFQH